MTRTLTRWLSDLRRWGRRCLRLGRPDARPTGARGVAELGHRDYVGGRWEEIGRLQFDYLCARGLRPDQTLLDVACGSLRAGVWLIPYLDADRYWGLEKEPDLVNAGLSRELSAHIREQKNPRFLINSEFEVSGMEGPADVIWVHSLLTHLPLNMIGECLNRLKEAATSTTVCYATFFETMVVRENLAGAHDHETFFYTVEELTGRCAAAGWKLKYVGDWGHPRGQKMVELRLISVADDTGKRGGLSSLP